MRLLAKLLVMVAMAIGAQAWIERQAGWLDETWFTVQVGLHNLVPGADPEDPAIMEAADGLLTRSAERTCRGFERVVAGGGERG